MSFQELNLDPRLLKAVQACGFATPTDIQRTAIPAVLAGRDLMASAQTGTGKTAAFVLPVLQRLLASAPGRPVGRGPRALVLTPTRELALQIHDHLRHLGRFCRLSHGSIVGGVGYGPQRQLLRTPLDILIATPGRLLDLMAQGQADFVRLEILVLDEADRMLDMGFVHAVRRLAAAMPRTRQTLLFSATLEGEVERVARALLHDPARIQLAANHQRHAAINQCLHLADDGAHKQRLLAHYLASDSLTRAVVFTATKRGADRLAKALAAKGHACAALHGDMNQGQRRRTVERLQRGELRVLVATDVAARGLDVKGITHVINFDLPMVPEDYIHRIGRTGRAGATGWAVSLVGPDDRARLAGIERLTGQRLKRSLVPGLEPMLDQGTDPGRRGRGARRAGARRSGNPGPRRQARHGGPRSERRREERRAGEDTPRREGGSSDAGRRRPPLRYEPVLG